MVRLVLCALLAVTSASRVRRIVGGYEAEPPLSPAVADSLRGTGETPQPPPPLRPQPTTSPAPPVRPPDNSRVEIRGTKTREGHEAFLGIRYAVAPVGKLRFQRPRRLYLTGEVDATKYGPPCSQYDKSTGRVIGKEDCLFLNVYTQPSSNRSSALPVFFWIHGGHYARGSGNQYDPSKLVSRGIVVVTVQYRLGTLGFLSLNNEDLPGNQGLFDCAAALRWTSYYISSFGGDPKRITVGGQGSGASIATYLAVNKFTTDLVSGIVAMSGTALSPFSVDKNETITSNEVSEATGGACKINMPRQEYIKCMQYLPVDKIVRGEFEVAQKKRNKLGVSGVASVLVPAVSEDKKDDDRYLPSFLGGSPMDLLNKAKLNKPIPMLTGVTKQETGGAMQGSFFNQLKQLPQQLFSNSLFKDLHIANTGLYQNKTANPTLTSLFSTSAYTNFFNTLLQQSKDQLTKLIKATTDAFFNLPVFITSHVWSKKSPIYLYSFEQQIKKSNSDKFLTDLALAGQTTTREAHHGDDLIYIFNPQNMIGQPIRGNYLEGDDRTISNYMINTISSFVYDGKPNIKDGLKWSPFSPERNNYMIISMNPREADNFHKCDMGLWSADSGILKSKECSSILPGVNETLNSVPGVKSLLGSGNSGVDQLKKGIESASKPLTDTFGSITKPLKKPLNPLARISPAFG